MELYIAKIEETATPDDFRITLRILPNLIDIEGNSNLPRFPFFFGNKGYTGKIGELVWVVSNDEFTMGYVMGRISKFDWNEDYSSQSITKVTFDKITNIRVDLGGGRFLLTDLELTYWDNTCIHAINRRDGSTIIGYSSGALHILSPTEVLHVIPNEESKMKKSIFQMTKDKITLKAESIYLNAEDVYLGRYFYGSMLVTQGSGLNFATAAKGIHA